MSVMKESAPTARLKGAGSHAVWITPKSEWRDRPHVTVTFPAGSMSFSASLDDLQAFAEKLTALLRVEP